MRGCSGDILFDLVIRMRKKYLYKLFKKLDKKLPVPPSPKLPTEPKMLKKKCSSVQENL